MTRKPPKRAKKKRTRVASLGARKGKPVPFESVVQRLLETPPKLKH